MAEVKNTVLNDEQMENATGGMNEYPVYDMLGIVIGKNANSAIFYDVKGDNDEVFVCNLIGDIEVMPGDQVYMYEITQDGDLGWAIEPVLDLKK